MEAFMRKFAGRVTGVLSGFDRLVFRGALRKLTCVAGVVTFLLSRKVRFIDYGAFVEGQTRQLIDASLAAAYSAISSME